MHVQRQRTRWRIGSILAVSLVAASVSLTAGPAIAEPQHVEATDDYVEFDFDSGERVNPAVQALAGQDGYTPYAGVSANVYKYTVKLLASPRVEQYRVVAQAVANELRTAGIADLTIAPGQTADTGQAALENEILFRAVTDNPCGPSVAGCGGPSTSYRANGTDSIAKSGRVWILPIVDPYSPQNKHHVVSHELGHALGLLHHDIAYQGKTQVMHSNSYDSSIFQTGDKNGLAYLSRNTAPLGSIDAVTVPSAGTMRVTGWAFDPDQRPAATMRITVDGKSVVQQVTDRNRADVETAYKLPHWAVRGFDITTALAAGAHTVCLDVMNYPRTTFTQVACRAITSAGMVTSSRIQGADRYDSSAAVSRAAFPSTAPVVVIANGDAFPDALAAGPVAAKLGGSLLLTQSTALTAVTKTEIARLKPSKIIVAGGPAIVAEHVVTDLKKLSSSVVRVSGADRYETSRKLASYAFTTADLAFVASGDTFPDALSAGAGAAGKGGPLVLVSSGPTAADAAAGALLKSLKATAVRVVGGTAVITDSTLNTLKASVANTARVAGADRFLTSIAISKNYFSTKTPQVYVVSGMNFPDGLVAAPLAARTKSPVFLSPGYCVNREVLTEMERLGATKLTLIGGTNSLNTDVAAIKICA
jgi:putative cell wall-binding protein